MNKKEHTIWNEKYRSTSLDNYLCTGYIKNKIEEYITNQDIPHIGLFGNPGSGKTTLAKLLVNNIDCDFIYLNAMDNRSMDDIKDKIGGFASTKSFKGMKIVILDESTNILQNSQILLLNMIETYSLNTRFILTGNYPERLIPALRSRLQELNLEPPSIKQVASHVLKILDGENITYEKNDVGYIVTQMYPDMRRIINSLQKYTIDNILHIDTNKISQEDKYILDIIEELKKPSFKSFNVIRQIVLDSNRNDLDDVYKHLYDNVSEYASGFEGIITVIIEEYLYHRNFRIDGEICLMACIHKILETIPKNKLIK